VTCPGADELAKKRFTRELKNLDKATEPNAVKKAALLIVLSLNRHQTLSQTEASLVLGISPKTISSRMRGRPACIFGGLHVGQ
jgi:hypothetical protein